MKQAITPDQFKHINNLATKRPEIVAGYLFGSYAKNKQRIDSDIDLGFICVEKKDIDVLAFSLAVSRLFLPLQTDVIIADLSESPLILIQMINGKVIYENDKDQRVVLETRILKLYEDYLHLRRISNIYLNKSFTEGIYARK